MADSILNDVKATLGMSSGDTSFDTEVILHTNSAISFLEQLGIGPTGGLAIANTSTGWAALLGTDANLNLAKSYIYLRVRLLFDPPTTSYMIEAMNAQIRELESRLNMYREDTAWTNPLTT